MRTISEIHIENLEDFKQIVLMKSKEYSHSCILDSNDTESALNKGKYEFLAALGSEELLESYSNSFHCLDSFYKEKKDWVFGALTYEIRNELNIPKSKNKSTVEFPNLFFFIPRTVVYVLRDNPNKALILSYDKNFHLDEKQTLAKPIKKSFTPGFNSNFTKQEYLHTVQEIKNNIEEGLYYELNLCQEFVALNTTIDPINLYQRMSNSNPAPFSVFMKWDTRYLLCSSPERFLLKEGLIVTSQPIKGTCRRGDTEKEDLELKANLLQDEKERAENVMIVDLVRNDLSQTCETGTVVVEELFGIYSYQYVHQMISTIAGKIPSPLETIECIKKAFPMGSMTGAPKLEVIKNVEKLEKSARGLYSGSVGYIDPNGDFDFNVVIRSLIYDQVKAKLSYHVGGAITYDSIPENEYEECLLKAKGITSLFD